MGPSPINLPPLLEETPGSATGLNKSTTDSRPWDNIFPRVLLRPLVEILLVLMEVLELGVRNSPRWKLWGWLWNISGVFSNFLMIMMDLTSLLLPPRPLLRVRCPGLDNVKLIILWSWDFIQVMLEVTLDIRNTICIIWDRTLALDLQQRPVRKPLVRRLLVLFPRPHQLEVKVMEPVLRGPYIRRTMTPMTFMNQRVQKMRNCWIAFPGGSRAKDSPEVMGDVLPFLSRCVFV